LLNYVRCAHSDVNLFIFYRIFGKSLNKDKFEHLRHFSSILAVFFLFERSKYKVFSIYYKLYEILLKGYRYWWRYENLAFFSMSKERRNCSQHFSFRNISRSEKMIKSWYFSQKVRREKLYKNYINQSYWLALVAFFLIQYEQPIWQYEFPAG
jgi:hypothetical protein